MDGSGDSGNCDLRGTISGKEKQMGDFGGEKTGETWCINQDPTRIKSHTHDIMRKISTEMSYTCGLIQF